MSHTEGKVHFPNGKPGIVKPDGQPVHPLDEPVTLTDGTTITRGQLMLAVHWLRRDLRILPT